MTDLAALVVRMQADNSQYIKALDQATQKLQKFQNDQTSSLGEIAKTLGEIPEKIAAAFAIDKAIEFSERAIDAAASLDRLSQSAGVSVGTLAGMSNAFAGSGVDTEQLGTAFKKLNVAISDAGGAPTSKAGEAFRTLGINVKDSNGNLKDAGTVMKELADKFAGTADGANKTALAVAILGRSGEQMIPALDKGSAALEESARQLEAWGLKITGPEAGAAEEFKGKVEALGNALETKLGGELAAAILPVLESLIEAFTGTGTAAAAVSVVVSALADGFRLAGAAIVIVSGELIAIGQAALGLGQAFYDLNTFNWSKVGKDLTDGFGAAFKTTQKTIQSTFDVLDAGTEHSLAEFNLLDIAAKRIQPLKPQAASLTGTEEYDKGVEKLTAFNNELKDQAGAFGLGSAALVNYKLQFGPLADAIKAAGDKGKELAAQIRANAAELEQKQDTKTITDYTDKLQEEVDKLKQGELAAVQYAEAHGKLGEALKHSADGGAAAKTQIEGLTISLTKAKDDQALFRIDQELQTLKGHLVEAEAAAFDFNNQMLARNLKSTGAAGDAGLAQLEQLKALKLAQAGVNEQTEKGSEINLQFASTEADITLAQSRGTITDLQAMAQTDVARKAEIAQLEVVYEKMEAIAQASGDPKLIQGAQQLQNQIKALEAQTDQLTTQVRNNLESAFADNFSKLISGGESFKKFLQGFLKDIESQIDQMVSKNVAQSIFGTGGAGGGIAPELASLFGGSSAAGGGASGAGIFGSYLSSLFGGGAGAGVAAPGTGVLASAPAVDSSFGAIGGVGNAAFADIGAFASGGTIPSGAMGIVGENGPELAYSGAKDMQIIPNGAIGKQLQVTNHFTVNAPGGTISRASQMQTAAAAARALGQANQRNNAG